MPTYQYACTVCGDQLEVVQKFSDDPLTVCPACSGRLRKVFSPVGVVFKGSGFYRTDSRGKSSDGAASPAAKPAEAGSSASSGTPSSTTSSTTSGGGKAGDASGKKSGTATGSKVA